MSHNKNRRLISGERALCKCSLDLPNLDPFSGIKINRSGYFVLNVRGGSLYLPHQFTRDNVASTFPPDRVVVIKRVTLYPVESQPIALGNLSVRYLKMTDGLKFSGLVLRFVNLSEAQLDALNELPRHFSIVSEHEESVIASVMHQQNAG